MIRRFFGLVRRYDLTILGSNFVLLVFLGCWLTSVAQAAETEAPFAQCPATRALLASTLPIVVEGNAVSSGSQEVRRALDQVERTYIAAAANGWQMDEYHAAVNRLRELLWQSHDISNLFWSRDYYSLGAVPALDQSAQERDRALLKLAEQVHSNLEVSRAEASACVPLRQAVVEAALWAMSSAARRLQASGADASEFNPAMQRLAQVASDCDSVPNCLLMARIATIHAEAPNLSDEARDSFRTNALQMARLGLERASVSGPSLELAEAWMHVAELEALPGSPDLAAEPLGQALDALDMSVRSEQGIALTAVLPNEFKYRQLPIYQHGADSVFARNANANPAERNAALIAIGEAARRAQIENVLGDACDPLEVPLSPNALRAGERLVYPILGVRRLYLLVGSAPGNSDDAGGWRLAAAMSAERVGLERNANRLVAFLQLATDETIRQATYLSYDQSRSLPHDDAGPANPEPDWGAAEAQSLHAALIAPLIEAGFISDEEKDANADDADVGTVIFLPDPALRNVPWAILRSSPSSSFLVQHVAIAVAPALAYVRPPSRDPDRGGLLAAGLREPDGILEGFVTSLRIIGPRGRISSPIIDTDFTKTGFLDTVESSSHPVLLLATHARFDGMRSDFLVNGLTNGGSSLVTVSELEGSLRANRRRARRIELLILISCQGAAGDAGELGLAGLALRGGARTTIGAVTKVNSNAAPEYFARPAPEMVGDDRDYDESTAPSNTTFLSRYYSGHSPAHALRTAQLATDGDGELAYPPNWGSFLVVGSWR